VGYSSAHRIGRTYVVMESTPAEVLPDLYRAILDAVAQLEAAGDRARAGRLRRDATAAYSRAWDERARRRLEVLLRDAARPEVDDRRRRVLGRGLGRGATRAAARRPAPARLGQGVPPVAHQDG
jgi:hypothetical protein